ncbi:MAG: hypothetical protein H6862_00090 [Rhodospirillales bacterium]|nr:hypothetical protein [Rhodospirillales bacterium]
MQYAFVQWLDFLWLPVAFLAPHGNQKYYASALTLSCLVSLRLQTELLTWAGIGVTGATGYFSMPPMMRGMMTYAVLLGLFFILSYYSPNTRGVIYMAACLSVYVISFCISFLMMTI